MKIFYKNDYRPELWLGDRLLYSTLLEDDLRSEFNITTKVADRKVTLYTDTNKVLDKYIDNLKNHYSGKYYLTDWGDGTKDNLTEHTYAEPGSYTIKTHYVDAYPEVNSYATTILLKINYSIFKKVSFNSHILLGYALTQYTSLEGAKVIVDDTTSFFNVEKGLKYFPNISLYGVASVDFENVKTNNMTSLYGAFHFGYSNVEYITGISSWDTSNVTDMSWMFYGCNALKSLDVSGWNTSKVTSMSEMFYGCTSLKSLDLSSWDVSNVYNMENMFYNSSSLESLNLSTWVFKKVSDAKNMFYNLKYLIDWHYDGTNYANWNMSETYTGFSYVFPWNNKYTSFEYRIDPVNPDEYINSEAYLPSLQTIDYDDYTFSGFDILVKKLDGNVYTYNYIDNVQAKDVDSIIVTLSSEYTFKKLRFNNYSSNYIKEFITIPDLSHDVFNINSFYYMFGHCTSLVSLDLSSWDVSNVTDMSNMFYKCSSLESLNVSGWNTSNVTNMNHMFDWCKSLTSLDLSSWDTSKVTNMGYMFNRCSSLNILNLSNFDTSKVTENENMLVGVPANVDWQYDGSGYSKFTLLESDTNFSGVFPWITYKNSLMYTISAEDDTHTLNGNYANYYLPIIHVDTGSGNLITVIKTGVTILKKDGTSVNDITGVLAKDVEQIIIDFTNLKDYTFLGMPYRITEIQKMIGMEFLPNLHSLFFDCSLLKSLDLSSWNVSNVTEMSWMFYKCTSLESLNLSTWDTRKVTNPSAMFYQVPEDVDWHFERGNYTNFTLTESDTSFSGEFPWNLDKIIARYTFNSSEDTMPTFGTSFTSYEVSDIDNEDGTTTRTIVRTSDELPTQIKFENKTGLVSVKILDISGITTMYRMFYGCSSLTSLDVSSWNTSSVTNMSNMFCGCKSLTSLDLSSWNTSSVTNMSNMFDGCTSLTTLDVSSWNTSNVTKMNSMFYDCTALNSLDISSWNTSKVTNMSHMFYDCTALNSLDISSWVTSSVTTMQSMFYDCTALNSLDISSWNTSKVTDMSHMFGGCKSLTSLDLSSWVTSNVTDMNWMFYGCTALTLLNLSTWNTSNVTNMSDMFCGCKSLTSLDLSSWDTSNVTDMSCIIQRCSSLTSIDLSNFDTSKVTLMSGVFEGCSSLTSLNLSSWNTSNVTDMSRAFYGCTALTSLNLSTWNTSNVTTMSNMFNKCTSLTSLDLSNFDIGKLTTMSYMFKECTSLTSIDLSNFDTSSVTSMSNMFNNCSSLTSLDLSNFVTSNVTNMSYMFSSCPSLTSLDLSNFDTSKVTDMRSMFGWSSALTSLNLSTWNTSKVTNTKYMFSSITINDWHYDGTNYQNWTLNETDTGYNGKFPWNQE